MDRAFAGLGVKIPDILLPGPGVDLQKWAVVACDQYTSQPDYWEGVEKLVKHFPSTCHLVLPEIYLGRGGEAERICKIHRTMKEYLLDGTLLSCGAGFIYLERSTPRVKIRRGLMAALDLEYYDYRPGSPSYIRATEATVLERIPPRVRIREGASLEIPHIMVLIDDPERLVIEPLGRDPAAMKQVYDTDLMMNGGHITGHLVKGAEQIRGIYRGLRKLAGRSPDGSVFLFAVGDGNHSLATAKTVWERIKAAAARGAAFEHPARYALVELVNVHDEGLRFEPIHRVVFGAPPEVLFAAMRHFYERKGAVFEIKEENGDISGSGSGSRLRAQGSHFLAYTTVASSGYIRIQNPPHILEAGTLQIFLNDFLKENKDAGVDYIHGTEVVSGLGRKPGNTGFYLPPIPKENLYKTVARYGILPPKTFSMGEAEEKRYYMECRKIV
ncbi:MAG: DUF1015 domain-containing protein [Bacillota bacterium]